MAAGGEAETEDGQARDAEVAREAKDGWPIVGQAQRVQPEWEDLADVDQGVWMIAIAAMVVSTTPRLRLR